MLTLMLQCSSKIGHWALMQWSLKIYRYWLAYWLAWWSFCVNSRCQKQWWTRHPKTYWQHRLNHSTSSLTRQLVHFSAKSHPRESLWPVTAAELLHQGFTPCAVERCSVWYWSAKNAKPQNCKNRLSQTINSSVWAQKITPLSVQW